MVPHLIRRFFFALATAAGISIVSFVAIHARPDDALAHLATRLHASTPEQREALAKATGLDRPLPARLVAWLGGVARGDLGDSWGRSGESVATTLRENLPLTLALTGSGLLIQLGLGLLLAAYTVRRRGTWRESLTTTLALVVHAMPQFCLGLLLLWPLAFKLGWFPTSGAASSPWEQSVSLLDRLHHLILPAACLGIGGAIVVARLLRTRWEEELDSAYVVAARARGIPEWVVLWKHSLPAATGPLFTAIGLSLPALVGGAVVVERVFNWPGLGNVLLEAIAGRDLPLLAGVNLVFALLVALGGLLSDVAVLLVDPRVRLR